MRQYVGAICNSSATSPGDVLSYFSNIPLGSHWIVILRRMGYTWDDSVSIYILSYGNDRAYYGKSIIKEGASSQCPKLDSNYHVTLPSTSQYGITIEIVRLVTQ